jgi:hypothetical protein
VEDTEKKDYEKHPRNDHVYLDVCFVRGWLEAAAKHEGVNRTYRIPVTELHVRRATVAVRAKSPDDARERVARCEGRLQYAGNVEGPRVYFDDEVESKLRSVADHFRDHPTTRDE